MLGIPDHWRKGLLRLYLAIAIPWSGWFGYAAFEANRVYVFNRDYVNALDASPNSDRRYYVQSDNIRYQFLQERNAALRMLPIVPVGLPPLAVVCAWIAAGFGRPKQHEKIDR